MKDHFDKTYWYIIGNTAVILIYIAAVTFIPIPKENQRFVDIALGILLGILNSNGNYLTGGNPGTQKKQGEAGSTTAEISATIHSEPKEENEK